ncbi:VOC family protein [Bacillus mangrovi]|uniref:VOC family protein n=1 Tax=Metabacillus mangrovi TaxID=1491830 RepID=A0A7X2V6A9_9BACI|nr:VOC family protein [Metabacillus mangrovi]MTH55051.1 VOC family protein [Metabacillus mangrovi]
MTISNQIGTVFIPVQNIEKARDWYCRLLNVKADGEIQFGHLYILPMKGPGIVLDSKIYSPEHTFKTPAFHFNTDDVEAAFFYVKNLEIELVTGIEHGHYFTFKDPDGNHLMVCQC